MIPRPPARALPAPAPPAPAPPPARRSPARGLLLLAFAFAVMADPFSSVAYARAAALRALDGRLALLARRVRAGRPRGIAAAVPPAGDGPEAR